MASQANPEIDSLFEVPPAGFVKARNDLVKALKAHGKREAAEQAAGLSRPTASVWASNQVARRAADLVSRLADVTARLQGGVTRDREKYTAAINQHRELLNEVRARIEAVLSDAGLRAPPSTVAAAVQNFRTGLMDAHARALLERGRLTEDLGLESGAGLFGGAMLGASEPSQPATAHHATKGPEPHASRPPAAAHDRRQAEAAAKERERARREKEQALAKARAEAQRQVQALRKAAHAAAGAREKQKAALEAARRHLESAERAHAAAQAEEQDANDRLGQAEAALDGLPRHLQ